MLSLGRNIWTPPSGLLKALSHLYGDINGFLDREGTFCDPLFQSLSIITSHDDENLTLFGLFNFMNGADIGMIKGRSSLGFVDEPFLSFRIFCQLRRQEFKGHCPLELGILGFVDNTHPAFA